MNPFEEAHRALHDGPSAARRNLQRARLLRSLASPRPITRVRLALATCALVAASALAAWWVRTDNPHIDDDDGPVELHTSLVATSSRELRFSEGSRVTMEPGTEAFVSLLTASQVDVTLERGRLDAAVQKRTGRTWRYHAGPYTVRVLGTRLSIDWRPAKGVIEVAVSEGSVEVSGPEGAAVVRSGQSLRRVSALLSPAQSAQPPVAPAPALAHPAVALPPAAPATTAQPGWQELLRAGRRAAALEAALGDDLAGLNDADALELADAARLERHTSTARQLLSQVLGHQRRDAAEAAFLLGRIESDAHQLPAARRYFTQAATLSPEGPFVEQARGRLLEVLLELDAVGEARGAARDYLAHHPQGAWADLAKKVDTQP
jgi:hypothetical protein